MARPILAPTRPDWDKPNLPTPEEWERVRGVFTRYYLNIDSPYGKATLNEIRKIMAQEHQFHANETQYKNKIKKWGLRRNLNKSMVESMSQIQDERAQRGKKTTFKFHGRCIPEKQLLRMYGNLSSVPSYEPADMDTIPTHGTPTTPPAISYSTPAPRDVPGADEIYSFIRVFRSNKPHYPDDPALDILFGEGMHNDYHVELPEEPYNRRFPISPSSGRSSLRGCVWMSSGWGGESVIGSWIKDDVVMSGRSPFDTESHPAYSLEGL